MGNSQSLKRGGLRKAKKPAIKTEAVLGGGGVKGFAHLGFLRACEELSIAFTKLTGVSIGSLVATFYANGYSVGEIDEIFREEVLRLKPRRIVSALIAPDALLGAKEVGLGLVGLTALNREIVDNYGLEPKKNLRIVAYSLVRREPVVFEGTNYDLVDALSASCAVPLVMRPIWYGQSNPKGIVDTLYRSITGNASHDVLVDGGVHHPCPGDFCKSRAVISKLGFVTRLPGPGLGPVDMYFHALELVATPLLNRLFPDPEEHLVINVGPTDVAGLSFGISPQTCDLMIENGYAVASRELQKAITAGEL